MEPRYYIACWPRMTRRENIDQFCVLYDCIRATGASTQAQLEAAIRDSGVRRTPYFVAYCIRNDWLKPCRRDRRMQVKPVTNRRRRRA